MSNESKLHYIVGNQIIQNFQKGWIILHQLKILPQNWLNMKCLIARSHLYFNVIWHLTMQRKISIIVGSKKINSMSKLSLFPTFRKSDACHYQQQIVIYC